MKLSAFDVALEQIWALNEKNLRKVLTIATREHDVDFEAVEAAQGRRLDSAENASLRDGVATIPIVGPLFRYANMFTQISGATSIETTARDLRQAVNDPAVRAILLSVDSPGGTVSGTNELAKMVRAAAAAKPVAAYVSHAGASGAYWIASAANRVYVDETAMVGSIGVVAAFIDDSKRAEARGIRQVTFVSSQSPDKRPDVETAAGRAVIQRRVDNMAQIFIEAVARHRGVDAATVMRDFGRGDVLLGRDAVRAGMADGVSSYEEVLAGLAAGNLAAAAGGPRPVAAVAAKLIPAAKIAAAAPALPALSAAAALGTDAPATAAALPLADVRAAPAALPPAAASPVREGAAAAPAAPKAASSRAIDPFVLADRIRGKMDAEAKAGRPIDAVTALRLLNMKPYVPGGTVDPAALAVSIRDKVDAEAAAGRTVTCVEALRMLETEPYAPDARRVDPAALAIAIREIIDSEAAAGRDISCVEAMRVLESEKATGMRR